MTGENYEGWQWKRNSVSKEGKMIMARHPESTSAAWKQPVVGLRRVHYWHTQVIVDAMTGKNARGMNSDRCKSKTQSDSEVHESNKIRNAPGVSLPRCSFLVKSRPLASSSLVSCIPSIISMEAFSANDITSYSTQYSSTQEESKQFLSSIKARPSAYSLRSLPINLAVMIFIFANCNMTLPSLPSTLTEQFESLMLVLLLCHLQTNLGHHALDNLPSFSQLPDALKPPFNSLCQLVHLLPFWLSVIEPSDRISFVHCGCLKQMKINNNMVNYTILVVSWTMLPWAQFSSSLPDALSLKENLQACWYFATDYMYYRLSLNHH